MAKPSTRIIATLNKLGFSPPKSSPQNGFCYSSSTNTSSSFQLPHLLRAYYSPRFSSSTNLTSPCIHRNHILSRTLHHSSTPSVLPNSSSSSSSSSSTGVSYSRIFTPGCLNYKFPFKPSLFPSSSSLGFSKLRTNPLGNRYFSIKTSNFRGPNDKFKKSVVDKPLSAVTSAFLRYREAVGLQVEAFWKRNYLVIVGIGGVALCILLWRIMFGIASTFIGLSEGMAKYGFLALSSAVVAFTGLYVRSRFTINPDKVYRIAMRKLNTSAGILEIMGAPLSGTDLRAYVMSGGGIGLKNFKLKLRNKRCFLIFPIRGSERRGLVSVEAKKKKGQYDMRLLAVDIPMIAGPDQRFFLIGNEEEYQIGGGLISELRDPIVKAMAAEKEFEDLDQQEEEEDAERELEEAERKNREEIEKIEKSERKNEEAERKNREEMEKIEKGGP